MADHDPTPETPDQRRERRAARERRLAELGFERSTAYADRQDETLVTFIGEARADPPDPTTVELAHRELIAALDEIDRTLSAEAGHPAAAIASVGQTARGARERYADALNTTAQPASRPPR